MKVGGYWSNATQGGLFSTIFIDDSYQESYQSYEIVGYETTHWPASRRCGYVFHSSVKSSAIGGSGVEYGDYGTTYGNYASQEGYICNCSQITSYTTYGPHGFNKYHHRSAVCNPNLSSSSTWGDQHTCPKGWGKGVQFTPVNKDYTQAAQGYVVNASTGDPIYDYVTRYKTVYYDYIGSRVAKT